MWRSARSPITPGIWAVSSTPSSNPNRWSRILCSRHSLAPPTKSGSGGWLPRLSSRNRSTRVPIEFSRFGRGEPLVLIAGPCVIESEEHIHFLAHAIRDMVGEFVFKASFDKANRTSAGAYRGPGVREGLRILAGVRDAG